jgi:hypothetical protein
MAVIVASVPEEVMRSISIASIRRVTSRASSTSPAVGAPKLVPLAVASVTAATIRGWAWPWINGPHEQT